MNFDFTTYPKRTKFAFATCMFFMRRDEDFVEVYLDEIAAAACAANTQVAKALGILNEDLDLTDLLSCLISVTVVHEWLHEVAGLEEPPTRWATQQVEETLTNRNWPENILQTYRTGIDGEVRRAPQRMGQRNARFQYAI